MNSGLILIDAHSSNPFTLYTNKQCINRYFIKTDKFIYSSVKEKAGSIENCSKRKG